MKRPKNSKPSDKRIVNLKPDQIIQITKHVKKEFYKTIISFLSILVLIFGVGVWYIYINAIENLKNLLVNRISEEFKQPTIRKTIEDVAANNAKQIFKDEIQPEVIKFKTDIRNEMDKFEKSINERVDKIANNKQSELTQQFPNGYAVLGFASGHRVAIPKTNVPDGLKVDWNNTKVEEINNDSIKIIFPDIIFSIQNIAINNCAIILPKKVGSNGVWGRVGNWVLYAEILDIEKDLIVISVGFKQINRP